MTVVPLSELNYICNCVFILEHPTILFVDYLTRLILTGPNASPFRLYDLICASVNISSLERFITDCSDGSRITSFAQQQVSLINSETTSCYDSSVVRAFASDRRLGFKSQSGHAKFKNGT